MNRLEDDPLPTASYMLSQGFQWSLSDLATIADQNEALPLMIYLEQAFYQGPGLTLPALQTILNIKGSPAVHMLLASSVSGDLTRFDHLMFLMEFLNEETLDRVLKRVEDELPPWVGDAQAWEALEKRLIELNPSDRLMVNQLRSSYAAIQTDL